MRLIARVFPITILALASGACCCLIAIQEVPVMADTIVIMDLNPLYTN